MSNFSSQIIEREAPATQITVSILIIFLLKSLFQVYSEQSTACANVGICFERKPQYFSNFKKYGT